MKKKLLLTRRRAVKLGFGMLAGGVGSVATSKAINLNNQIQALDNPNRKFSVSGKFSLLPQLSNSARFCIQ